MLTRILISILTLSLAVANTLSATITIDATSLVLIIISILPWIAPLLKSLELPGGFKVQFRDIERITERAEEIGLVSDPIPDDELHEYSFQQVSTSDPAFALAGLRIEIESRIKKIAKSHGIGTERQGVGRLIQILKNTEIIGHQESSVLLDLIVILNNAVHAESNDARSTIWAIEIGPRLLKALDAKI
ncbi:MAG: hypothetical protein IIA59_12170 [Candidatus Marinimicrobia bacterium]|nr:hypothetical protein [Candidatus Neomarinimicrobiota bacterium]